jgi:hypothetical protein
MDFSWIDAPNIDGFLIGMPFICAVKLADSTYGPSLVDGIGGYDEDQLYRRAWKRRSYNPDTVDTLILTPDEAKANLNNLELTLYTPYEIADLQEKFTKKFGHAVSWEESIPRKRHHFISTASGWWLFYCNKQEIILRISIECFADHDTEVQLFLSDREQEFRHAKCANLDIIKKECGPLEMLDQRLRL